MIVTGKVLKTLRTEAGLSQQEVARLAGISQAHVAKIESESVDPRLSTVNKIISVLKERKMGTRCGDIMTKNIISVHPNESVERVVKLMRSLNVSQVPVFIGKKHVGSIREKTIMRNLDKKLNSLSVRNIIDNPFPIVNVDDPIDMLPAILDFHPAVLVSKNGKICGIITKSDMLNVK